MASELQHLSDYNPDELPGADELRSLRFGIVVADWNSQITFKLLDGAVQTLRQHGVMEDNIETIHVPGTIELTYAARKLMDQRTFNAIIAIGCVVRGDTPHFDYVCQSATQGITALNAMGDIPVVFSVLTTEDMQQALDRA
ncbi:MAG: 6,7-dimethyl-8-ribityllumazine synthase, partial [Paludibacteraceae bacterium]|nr:6,7-dimethyl-8-ribityllumazine synthase [Paludibacteraceae bacterium]